MSDEAKPLQPHQLRVVDEHQQLSDRLGKLEAYAASTEQGDGKFWSLPAAERLRLMRQLAAMRMYHSALSERIAAFE